MRFISRAGGVLLAASLALSFEAFGQSTIAQATSRGDLQQLAQRLETLHTRETRAAREWAAHAGKQSRHSRGWNPGRCRQR